MIVSGIKTVTATQAAAFAGSSQLANRIAVYIKNMDDSVAILANERPIEPGE